ncbi:hypothetical protein A1356_05805 [Methylomonas koyamae]|uniref:Uncharacterized protein n=1 Tax=Methylomonas koyamae TaxID=702114 RepID=A0AA91DG63_9GAMM|nr:hypothetical protein A1356_05805 [Methylomonas koyamae]
MDVSLVPTRCVGMPIYRAAVCVWPQRGQVLRYHAARGNEKKVILPYLLLVRVVFLPFCRAEHRRTWSESPARGAAGMPRVFRRGWEAPSENPDQVLRRAGNKRHGVSFLLDTFLWTSKEKYLGCRAETRLKINPSRQRHLIKKAMFALVVGVAPAYPKGHKWIAGAQKPRMAKFQHILVPWIPAIHAGMTASISFNC